MRWGWLMRLLGRWDDDPEVKRAQEAAQEVTAAIEETRSATDAYWEARRKTDEARYRLIQGQVQLQRRGRR